MTVAAFKAYLKSLKFGGSVVDNTQNKIVNAAAEAAFGKVWESHVWKVSRKEDQSLATTTSQAYTNLPDDLSGLKTVTLIDGVSSRKINIFDEDNFEYDHPYPQAWSTQRPIRAKIVYNMPGQSDRWRLYWARIPDAAYTLHIVYRPVATIQFLPNCPAHMLEAMMLVASELLLPPGPSQQQQFSLGRAAIRDAINSDSSFIGSPELIGTEAGFNDWDTSRRSSVDRLDWPFG